MSGDDRKQYFPILKGKKGEFSALRELNEEQRSAITPLIEVPPGADPSAIVANIAENWSADLPIMVDFHLIDADIEPDPDGAFDTESNLQAAFTASKEHSLCLIPVAGITGADVNGIAAIHASHSCGVCLRLRSYDFEDGNVTTRVHDWIQALGLQQNEVDLLVDLGAINQEQNAIYIMAIAGMLSMLSSIDARRFILSSSAFPENLSGISRDSIARVPRADWLLWNTVIDRISAPQRIPSYSDYAISHPELPNIDPRLMNPSAGIRYTIDENWLVVKGRGLRSEAGFAQFRDLSRQLMEQPEFNGLENCWGDTFISECAHGGKTGNLTTWRKVGTNRHLCKVIDQLANRS